MGRVDNRVALVTGAASGLGREIALRLAREGARVVLTDLNEAAGAATAAEIGASALFLRHDVTSADDWQQVMQAVQQRMGGLDILVNNAGILIPGNIETGSLEDFRRLLRVNTESVFLGCQHGVRALKERGGAIVNVASLSSWMPVQDYPGYSASKAAVAALTRGAALHCRNSGYAIRVNSVHPDGVWTPMMQASAPGVDPKYLLFDPKRNKAGRACTPDKVAAVVLFLASDDAAHVSGAEIRVDYAILGMGL
ncbi:MAG: SDR family oxidoreductase [Rubrivivax sp.]